MTWGDVLRFAVAMVLFTVMSAVVARFTGQQPSENEHLGNLVMAVGWTVLWAVREKRERAQ